MATSLNVSVLKAFDALDLFSETRPELMVQIVARELRMTYATAHRFMTTLEIAGILTVVRRGAYAPGRGSFTVATKSSIRTRQVAAGLGETVMACRFTPRGPICVAVSLAQRPISVQIQTGTTLSMMCTAQGHLFLAGMSSRDRAQWANAQGISPKALTALRPNLAHLHAEGHALNEGDNEPDIAVIAVPIKVAGRTVLTLSAFGTLSLFDESFFRRSEGVLKSAAAELLGEMPR